MDSELLNYNSDIPPDVDPSIWIRYLKGTREFDLLWGKQLRCPKNEEHVRCRCTTPTKSDYCRYFKGVAQLAEQIGGPVAAMIARMK